YLSRLRKHRVPDASRRTIRKNHRLKPANPSRRNRQIALAQAHECVRLFAAGRQPQNLASAIEDGIRQRHLAPSLVDTGYSYVRGSHVKDRIPWHQRGSMTIWS